MREVERMAAAEEKRREEARVLEKGAAGGRLYRGKSEARWHGRRGGDGSLRVAAAARESTATSPSALEIKRRSGIGPASWAAGGPGKGREGKERKMDSAQIEFFFLFLISSFTRN